MLGINGVILHLLLSAVMNPQSFMFVLYHVKWLHSSYKQLGECSNMSLCHEKTYRFIRGRNGYQQQRTLNDHMIYTESPIIHQKQHKSHCHLQASTIVQTGSTKCYVQFIFINK
jgi:hypothetical protein